MNEQVHVAGWPTFSLYTDFAYAFGHAAEGQCYVIAPCGVVTPAMLEVMNPPCPPEFLRPGGGYAVIIGPDGIGGGLCKRERRAKFSSLFRPR